MHKKIVKSTPIENPYPILPSMSKRITSPILCLESSQDNISKKDWRDIKILFKVQKICRKDIFKQQNKTIQSSKEMTWSKMVTSLEEREKTITNKIERLEKYYSELKYERKKAFTILKNTSNINKKVIDENSLDELIDESINGNNPDKKTFSQIWYHIDFTSNQEVSKYNKNLVHSEIRQDMDLLLPKKLTLPQSHLNIKRPLHCSKLRIHSRIPFDKEIGNFINQDRTENSIIFPEYNKYNSYPLIKSIEEDNPSKESKEYHYQRLEIQTSQDGPERHVRFLNRARYCEYKIPDRFIPAIYLTLPFGWTLSNCIFYYESTYLDDNVTALENSGRNLKKKFEFTKKNLQSGWRHLIVTHPPLKKPHQENKNNYTIHLPNGGASELMNLYSAESRLTKQLFPNINYKYPEGWAWLYLGLEYRPRFELIAFSSVPFVLAFAGIPSALYFIFAFLKGAGTDLSALETATNIPLSGLVADLTISGLVTPIIAYVALIFAFIYTYVTLDHRGFKCILRTGIKIAITAAALFIIIDLVFITLTIIYH